MPRTYKTFHFLMSQKSHVEKYLQITPGSFCLGTYHATTSFIERVQEEPQAAVMLHRPGMAEGEIGMLVAVCGDASDPVSCREAVLFAAAPELFEASMSIVQFFQQQPERLILLDHTPSLAGLRSLIMELRRATLKAIIDTQTPAQALARFDSNGS